MSEEKVLVITDKEELYDKCENIEELFDKYYLPLLDIHYRKTYKLQQENKELKKGIKKLSLRRNKYKRKYYNTKHILNELESWLEEKRDNANQECLDNISQNTADKVISYNIALTIKHDIEKVLDKLKELKNNE